MKDKKPRSSITIFLILLLVLTACKTLSPSSILSTPDDTTPTSQPTLASDEYKTPPRTTLTPEEDTPLPQATIATDTSEPEQICDTASLEELLEYVPITWAELHYMMLRFQTIYFFDLSMLRKDLEIPPIDGTSDREAKLDLVANFDIQGLNWIPEEIIPTSSSAFDQWGWDIADVHQALYIPYLDFAILKGSFARPEIRDRLIEAGYDETFSEDFSIFAIDGSDLQFALKPDTIMISGSENEKRALESFLLFMELQWAGLQDHPSVSPLVQYTECQWGSVLTPSINVSGLSQEYLSGLQSFRPDFLDKVAEIIEPEGGNPRILWDFMVVTFSGSKPGTTIRILYHYPSARQANEDKELVKTTLTITPTFRYRNQTWGDIIRVESIDVIDSILMVTAFTENINLLGNAFEGADFFGLLPVRTE